MKSLVLFLIAIFFIVSGAIFLDNQDKNNLDDVLDKLNNSDLIPPITQELCSEIQGVPAWVQNKEIIGYDLKKDWNVDYLIKNKIFFLYSTTCSVCHKQTFQSLHHP